SLHRGAGGHDRHAVAHREVDLALDTCAVPKRRDRYAATREVRRDVLDVTGDDEISAGELLDGRRDIAANDGRCDAGELLADPRQDLLRVPEHGVGIGRMPESANEYKPRTLCK